jgi:glycerol-3-phosphate dehydrogenase (NAD(P)+)
MSAVAVVGGGAWGTALALTAARAGNGVTLWARDAEVVAAINERGENPRYLPGVRVAGVTATTEAKALRSCEVTVLAVPAQSLRAVLSALAPSLKRGGVALIAAKGLERGSDKRLSEVVAEVAPAVVPAVLSGPGFALDVARGLPTAVTIAAADEALALELCRRFGSASFRPYAETDIIGVEIGGAVKNVLAIAAGIVSARQLGASALAALIARAFAELRRLAEAEGARADTLMGLSGLGDLVLTCSNPQSRNFAYGVLIGAGGDRNAPHRLAEGIATAAAARALARRHGIEMPIVEAVAAILDGTLSVDAAIEGLMARPIRREADARP